MMATDPRHEADRRHTAQAGVRDMVAPALAPLHGRPGSDRRSRGVGIPQPGLPDADRPAVDQGPGRLRDRHAEFSSDWCARSRRSRSARAARRSRSASSRWQWQPCSACSRADPEHAHDLDTRLPEDRHCADSARLLRRQRSRRERGRLAIRRLGHHGPGHRRRDDAGERDRPDRHPARQVSRHASAPAGKTPGTTACPAGLPGVGVGQ